MPLLLFEVEECGGGAEVVGWREEVEEVWVVSPDDLAHEALGVILKPVVRESHVVCVLAQEEDGGALDVAVAVGLGFGVEDTDFLDEIIDVEAVIITEPIF